MGLVVLETSYDRKQYALIYSCTLCDVGLLNNRVFGNNYIYQRERDTSSMVT